MNIGAFNHGISIPVPDPRARCPMPDARARCQAVLALSRAFDPAGGLLPLAGSAPAGVSLAETHDNS